MELYIKHLQDGNPEALSKIPRSFTGLNFNSAILVQEIYRYINEVKGWDTNHKPLANKENLMEVGKNLETLKQKPSIQREKKIFNDIVEAQNILYYFHQNYDSLPWLEWAKRPLESQDEIQQMLMQAKAVLTQAKLPALKRKLDEYIHRLGYIDALYDELPYSTESILKESFMKDWKENVKDNFTTALKEKASKQQTRIRPPISDETVELKLRNIVNKDIPKSITIDGKKYNINRAQLQFIKNEEEKAGGFLPLLPLILGGIAAAGSVAGGSAAIAQAVNKKKAEDAALAESQRHNQEMEKLAKGSGLYLNPPEGKGLKEAIKDFSRKTGLEEEGKRLIKNTLYNLSNAIKIESKGDGLFLSPA